MIRLKIVVIAASFSASAPLAFAQNCADPQTQTDMNICAGQEFGKADAALNLAYNAVLDRLSADRRTSLREAQRAWLVYRDKECAFETGGSIGGSIHPWVEAQCRTELTKQQTARLNALLHCQEGDVSCGGQ